MKNLTIAGGITRDAVLRTTQGGDKVAGFSVAVSEGFGDNRRTLYFDCSIWGKRAETLAPMLTKGGKVCVSGDLSTREHEGKTYLTLRANEVTLMSARQDDGAGNARQTSPPAQRSALDDEDSIPFAPEVR
jgi:single-strand DNA-binding protein